MAGRPKKLYTHNGESLSVSQWAAKLGVSRQCLYQKLNNGLEISEIITTTGPNKSDFSRHHKAGRARTLYMYNGELKDIYQLAEMAGVSCTAMRARLRYRDGDSYKAVNFVSDRVVGNRIKKPKNKGIYNKKYEYNGVSLTISQWAKVLGLTHGGVISRLKRMDISEALTLTKKGISRLRYKREVTNDKAVESEIQRRLASLIDLDNFNKIG